MLAGLTGEQWNAPSLCAGWRVREVAAHMTMGFRYSLPRWARELAAVRGNINRMADRCAHKDAAAFSPAELTAFLGENAEHPWKPPVGGYGMALAHDVVHGLDITVALGLDRRVPEDRLRVVLGGITARSVKFFGTDITGVAFRATDLDWSFGTGTPVSGAVSGAAQDLLLALFGRKLPADRLQGEPRERFVAARRS